MRGADRDREVTCAKLPRGNRQLLSTLRAEFWFTQVLKRRPCWSAAVRSNSPPCPVPTAPSSRPTRLLGNYR